MDGDPSVEPELDSFSLYLPLPYRVALIIVLGMTPMLRSGFQQTNRSLGVWAWGVNLHYLQLLKIVRNSLSAINEHIFTIL